MNAIARKIREIQKVTAGIRRVEACSFPASLHIETEVAHPNCSLISEPTLDGAPEKLMELKLFHRYVICTASKEGGGAE